MDIVSNDANWRQRLKTEERSAKAAGSEWGFMSGKIMPQKSRATSPAKYYGSSGGWTVLAKTLPYLGSQAQRDEPDEDPNIRSPTGYRTARAAALLSHSMRLDSISKCNVLYATSSKRYGSRLPIEQFGVAQHGKQATAITKLSLY